VRQDVHWGRGFALLRGIPVERYTPLQAALAYWGIGTYWGNPVRQNKKGHLLGHVKVGDMAAVTQSMDQAGKPLLAHASLA
jgi:hypothetical protein